MCYIVQTEAQECEQSISEKLKHSSLSSQFHFREDLEAVLHDVFSHAYEKGDRGEKIEKNWRI